MVGMLDLRTIFAVGVAGAALEAVTWLLFWAAWHRLESLKYFAAGFSAMSLGIGMMMLRGEAAPAWWIVTDSIIIRVGLVLIAIGLARFLGQPPRTKLMIGLLVALSAAWALSVVVAPGNVAYRFLAATVFTVVMMSLMSLSLLRDRSLPRLMRGVTVGTFCFYMAAGIVATVLEFRIPPETDGLVMLSDRNAWFVMQGIIFLTALFASLILMVSWRLSEDLRVNNAALRQEVEERRRLEEKLNASLETERVLREEQADFTRFVSHEFRTPIATIRNAAEMIVLTGQGIDPAARERLAGIGQALDRLSSLIDRFLSGDRGDSFHPEPLLLSDLMADVILHFDMTGGGDRLQIDLPDDGLQVEADPDMLLTAVINLVDNALKYSPEDSPVTLTAMEEQGRAAIRVTDTGIGIPEADRPSVGRRYFRASNTKPGTGAGMGLYASRQLVAYHDGDLVLLPCETGGTTAEIRLPVSRAPVREEQEVQPVCP